VGDSLYPLSGTSTHHPSRRLGLDPSTDDCRRPNCREEPTGAPLGCQVHSAHQSGSKWEEIRDGPEKFTPGHLPGQVPVGVVRILLWIEHGPTSWPAVFPGERIRLELLHELRAADPDGQQHWERARCFCLRRMSFESSGRRLRAQVHSDTPSRPTEAPFPPDPGAPGSSRSLYRPAAFPATRTALARLALVGYNAHMKSLAQSNRYLRDPDALEMIVVERARDSSIFEGARGLPSPQRRRGVEPPARRIASTKKTASGS